MKKIILSLIIILTIILGIPKVYSKGLFISKDNIKIEEDKDGTIFLLGNKVNINSSIDGLIFALGEKININHDENYLFLLAEEVNIKNDVLKDAFIIGSSINITGNLNRDSYIAGQDVKLNTTSKRNTYIYGDTVELNGNYEGNVTIYASSIKIKKSAKISGTLKYNKDATITGIGDIKTKTYNTSSKKSLKNIAYNLILSYLRLLIVGIILIYIFEKFNIKKDIKVKDKKEFAKITLKGMLTLIVIPILILITLCSSLFISLGVILLILYLLLIYLSKLITSLFIMNKLIKNKNEYIKLSCGLLLIYLLSLIPYIGDLFNILATSFGFGYLYYKLKKEKTS